MRWTGVIPASTTPFRAAIAPFEAARARRPAP